MKPALRFIFLVVLLGMIASHVLAHGDEDFGQQTFKIEHLPIVVAFVAIAIGGGILITKLILWRPGADDTSSDDKVIDPTQKSR